MGTLQTKTAIVTGVSRWMGASIAEQLAALGSSVVVNDAEHPQEAEAVVRRIKGVGGCAMVLHGDLRDPSAVRRIFNAAEATFDVVDILVNDVGMLPLRLPPLCKTDDPSFDRLVANHLRGPLHTLREAADRLKGGGRILNCASSGVGLAQPGDAIHAATKAAVEALKLAFAAPLRGRSIAVRAIAPGPIVSDAAPRTVGAAPRPSQPPEDMMAILAFLIGNDVPSRRATPLRHGAGVV